MADVFVSYVSDDRAMAEKIARGLESAGFSVWWDRHIRGGAQFTPEIERELEAAGAVIVLWSAASRNSQWVRDEASEARDKNKLIPLRLDAVQPPLGFRQVQSLAFAGWDGDTASPAFADLVESMQHLLGDAASVARSSGVPVAVIPAPPQIKQHRRPASTVRVAAAVIAIAMVGALGYWFLRDRPSTAADRLVANNGHVEISTFDALRNDEETKHFVAGIRGTIEHTFAANAITSQQHTRDAELLLRGSVDRDQDRFRISADLVRNREGVVLWSIATQGEPGEVEPVQERFALTVTAVLQCALANRKLAKDDPSAELLAKFLQYCAIEAGFSGQVSQLDALTAQIVQAAPQYAISYALRAVASAALANVPAVWGLLLKPDEEQARLHKVADDSAKAAVQLEPQNKHVEAIVDWALALNLDRRLAERILLLEKALAADAQFGPARAQYAALLSQVGRIDESRTEFERAAGAMPLSPEPAVYNALLTAAEGDVSGARQQLINIARTRTTNVGMSVTSVAHLPGLNVDVFRFFLEYWYGDPQEAKRFAESGRIADLSWSVRGAVRPCLDALLNARIQRKPMSQAQFDAVCTEATFELPAVFLNPYTYRICVPCAPIRVS